MKRKRPVEDSIKQFAQVLYALPTDLRDRLEAHVAEDFRKAGYAGQLSLLLPERDTGVEVSPSAARPASVPYVIGTSRRRKIAFGWYGGKFSHLGWLLPLLPPAHHYCEPFGGSAAVLLNRTPSPVETFNDIDGELVNFFLVLRDHTDDLLKAIALTPFSRREFTTAIASNGKEGLPPLERARRFFIRARQVRTGLAQTASEGRWANCKNTSRAGMAGAVSRWLGSVPDLPEIAARLLRVQFENRPAVEVIRMYDGKDTLFYCDPPYPHETRGDSKAYRYEMTAPDHKALAEVLKRVKGRVAVSGYRCELLDMLYKGWRCVCAPAKNCHSVKKIRVEAVWMNY